MNLQMDMKTELIYHKTSIDYSPSPSLFAVSETKGCCTITKGEAQDDLHI